MPVQMPFDENENDEPQEPFRRPPPARSNPPMRQQPSRSSLNQLNLGHNMNVAAAAFPGLYGMPAVIWACVFAILTIASGYFWYYYDLATTYEWANQLIALHSTNLPTWLTPAVSLLILALTLFPTAVQMAFVPIMSSGNRLLLIEVPYLLSVAFDVVTDDPRVSELYSMFGPDLASAVGLAYVGGVAAKWVLVLIMSVGMQHLTIVFLSMFVETVRGIYSRPSIHVGGPYAAR